MLIHKTNYNFSAYSISTQRKNFITKLSYSKDNFHTQFKYQPSYSIPSKISREGKLLKNLKLFNRFFLKIVIKNIKKLPSNNELKNIIRLYRSFYDINRVLFWRISKINPLFNLKKIKKKKFIYYMKKGRRNSLSLSWVNSIVLLNFKNINNQNELMFSPISNILCTNFSSNHLTKFKLKIYRYRFLRGE